jgi:hypothetical protein
MLVLTAIGSTHHRLDFLIGPGRPLDPDRLFIVCIDAIGNELTTAPSNSWTQPDLSFSAVYHRRHGREPAAPARRNVSTILRQSSFVFRLARQACGSVD